MHPTVAGVAMGLLLRCHTEGDETQSPGERVEHLVRPLSAGLAVPVFALFAGVGVSGLTLREVLAEVAPRVRSARRRRTLSSPGPICSPSRCRPVSASPSHC